MSNTENLLSSERLEAVFAILAREWPHPRPALDYSNAFEFLVAVVLSAQTTDAAVNRVTPALFAQAPCVNALVAMPEEEIESIIGVLGLGKTKAKRLHLLAQSLIENFGGEIPCGEAELRSLPGVGIKTARVIQNVIFKVPCVAVDTHVFRTAKRLGLASGKTPEAVSDELPKVIPDKYLLQAHHYLLLHGRHVCTARNPLCVSCLLANYCPKTGLVEVKKQ